MFIKEAVFTKKRKTVKVRVSDEEYGCDCCRKKIPIDDGTHLRVQIFNQEGGTTLPSTQLDFCSWKCLVKHLPKVKSNYFVSLPYLYFDGTGAKGCSGEYFLKILKEIR